MATKTINTRIKLKYDSLENWNKSTLVLLQGEIAVTTIPTGSDAHTNPPAIMFKVGDGEHTFAQLSWASGLAADVYSWAKAANKPSYTASEVGAATKADITTEINKLDVADTAVDGQYVSSVVETDGKIQVTRAALPVFTDTDTQYQLVLNDHTLKLQSKAKGGTWADVTGQSFTLPDNNTTYTFASTATSGASFKVTPSGGTAQTVYIDGLGSAAFKAEGDFDAKGAAAGVLGTSSDTATANTVYGAKKAAENAQSKADAALPKTDFETFKGTNTTAIADAKKAGTDAAAALETYKGTNDAAVSKNATDIANLQTAVKAGITFKGKVDALPATTNYSNGDLIIVGTKEYILYDDGTAKSWVELGDEGSHLTKATADTYYVPLARTIAGVDLKDNVTKAELQTALNVADGATKVVESTVSGWGFTKNKGTVTGISMNGEAKTVAADGSVDLGTVLTAHQDISGKQDKLSTTQLNAVNSGITAAKVTTYDGYATTIGNKQDKAISLTGITAKTVEGALTEINTLAGTKQTAAQVSNAITTELAKHAGIDKVGTVTSVSAGDGLKITGTAGVTPVVEIDDAVTFIFNCGSSTTVLEQ